MLVNAEDISWGVEVKVNSGFEFRDSFVASTGVNSLSFFAPFLLLFWRTELFSAKGVSTLEIHQKLAKMIEISRSQTIGKSIT